MTPVGKGYFILPDGQAIEVFEHLRAVEACPELYGLGPDELLPQSPEERRDREVRRRRILSQVLANGFTRVRFSKERRVCEFYAGTEEDEAERRALISNFLAREGVLECVVRNIRRSRGGGMQS